MFVRVATCAALLGAHGVFADSEPLIEVALAPPVGGSAGFANFAKQEASMEASALQSLSGAYQSAIASAKQQIDAAVKGSFLQKRSDEIFVRVLDAPAPASLGRAEAMEGMRQKMESASIAQAMSEFDSLTKVVVGELHNALHSSFLRGGQIGVKVKASDIPFASTLDLLRAQETGRDMSEEKLQSKVLDMQIAFVKTLNGMIAAALA
ncbi:unnamed protein product [Amoebophrya sp. A25]|nr:unnamed protein product [Amoebophrya sp. A25]CAD7975906.1 unnamed protein product [Amoebophrya sp. A25]|eukprot:GSA25T00026555001.1